LLSCLARWDFLDDRLLGSAPFGDVDGAADESEELAVGAETRLPRDDRPARLALVWLAEPAFEVKRTALIRGVEHRVGGAVAIVGVQHVQPAKAEGVLRFLTGELVPLAAPERPTRRAD